MYNCFFINYSWSCFRFTFFLHKNLRIHSTAMPSRESYVKKGKKQKKRASQKGSLFTALGLNVSAGSIPSLPDPAKGSGVHLNRTSTPSKPASPASTFWQPIRSFALSQLTSLVRRATLRESDLAPKYEKVHNFKVRCSSASCVTVSCLSDRFSSFTARKTSTKQCLFYVRAVINEK